MTLTQTTRLRCERARLKALAGRTSCGHLSNLIAASGSTRLLAAMNGMGLTGWGPVLLVGDLVFELGVVLLTPDALQKHVQRSYFGKGGDTKDKYETAADEEKAIRDMTEPLRPTPQTDVAGNMEIDPMMVAP